MATQFPDDRSAGMVDRIKRLLTAPKQEWPRIDSEAMTVRGIFMGWVVPLAAIGPVALLIGGILLSGGFLPFSFWLTLAISTYISSLLGVVILSLVVDALAPRFGATKNPVAAMKLAAFSYTAAWIAGICWLLPFLGSIGLLVGGIYSLYLLWLGLPLLMKPPADKTTTYFIVVLVVAALIGIVAQKVAGAIAYRAYTPAFVLGSADSGSVTIGGTTIDTGKLNAAAAKMEAATAQMQADARNGTSHAIAVADLQAMLPASVGGFARGDVETQSGSAAGIGGSQAKAHYTQGEQGFDLSVSDMGAMGAIATLGGAVNAQSSKTTATGYEKTEMVSGSMVSERWDNQNHSGGYSTVVGSRFAVEAQGSAPGIEVLKGAVGAIDAERLAGLAK